MKPPVQKFAVVAFVGWLFMRGSKYRALTGNILFGVLDKWSIMGGDRTWRFARKKFILPEIISVTMVIL